MKTAKDIMSWFVETEMYLSSTPFSLADVTAKSKAPKKLCGYAIQYMVEFNYAIPTSNDSKGHPRYIKHGAGRELIVKKWRKQNVGELIHYKGMHHFGNSNAGWRGAL